MSTNSIRDQLISKLKDKEYRDAFAAEEIHSVLPLKIWSLREQRKLSQRELGEKIGVAQAWVSKLEDPNYGKLTVSSLLRLASAFDVALEVDFVPFSKMLDKAVNSSPEPFAVASFEEDKGLKHKDQVNSTRDLAVTGSKPRARGRWGEPGASGQSACREFFLSTRLRTGQRFSGGESRILKFKPRQAA